MKILALVTDAFGGYGGIALYNRDFLSALCDYPNLERVVVVPRIMPLPSEPIPDKLVYVTKGLDSKFKYIKAVLQTLKRNDNFDILICGHINLLPIACLIRLFYKIPIIFLIYGIEAWGQKKNTILKYLSQRIDAYISISELTKERFLSWIGHNKLKGFILPNAIHTNTYGSAPKNQALIERYGLENSVILMTVGRLVSRERYKGFDEIIQLLPAIKKKIPKIKYLLVGDGPDRIRLENKAKDLDVIDRVVFTGFIPENVKADHFRLADAYVMPSRGEGFGFVFLEALACGIPTLGSKIDGSREALLDGKMGILVDPSNSEEIEKGIFETLKKPKGLIPHELKYFEYKNFQNRLHQIIDEISETKVTV